MKWNSFILALFILIPAAFAADPAADQLFENYFAIGTALSKDSLKDAQAAAKRLRGLIPENMQQTQAIKTEEQTDNERLATIGVVAGTIWRSKDLVGARKTFQELTVEFMGLKERIRYEKATEYYCPMVKQSWLQKEGKIQNPYMGLKMPECGEKRKKDSK